MEPVYSLGSISPVAYIHDHEEVIDSVGAALVAGSGIDITVDDAASTITINAINDPTPTTWVGTSSCAPLNSNNMLTGTYSSGTLSGSGTCAKCHARVDAGDALAHDEWHTAQEKRIELVESLLRDVLINKIDFDKVLDL
jgi:hypothetical protein